ncbi:hypothetical protein BZK31_23415 [Pseudomonas floridensis]|uniref:DUF3077 domain-containing protein n=1 Tax=Pseudomonas floridensis TaxID=1958950 RepID=A0A1X0N1S7_9PSED|nr:DUF3077 domain-containing protein [Pseudomonas floridensis]ORC56284.1 hypothetical protein BZK31_23415 [Pseudomonas floridensis]
MPTLNPASSGLFSINENLGAEDALNHASDLLRGIIATAGESADCSQTAMRDMTLAVVHLAQMAKILVDGSIDSIARH